jgi:polygalacturonase
MNHTNTLRITALLILVSFFFSTGKTQQNPVTAEKGWAQLKTVLAEIKLPVFPAKDFSILNYGAKGDGTTDCTEAFKKAIEACNQAGGGRVVVPEGVFLTGAIHLKSNVNLYVSDNATIKFSTDPNKYLPVVFTRFESTECYNYSALIYAFGQENIAITGKGKLDGQADDTNWWNWKGSRDPNAKTQTASVKALNKMGDDGVPVAQRVFGDGHYMRPNFIQLIKCKRVLIDGLSIVRSPMWEIDPVLSESVTVQNVKINSLGPNNDGCDPECCKNVLIKNCDFSTGDDCIAIKSGRNDDGRRINVPSENIVIQDCRMNDGHGGVVIGSEVSGSVRNVYAENCVMDSPNLDRALRIKTNSVRGGTIENIYMRNIKVGQVTEAVVLVSFKYQEGDAGKFTPVVKNVFVSNVTSEKSNYGLLFDAYERSPVTNVVIENCKFNGVKNGNLLNYTKDLTFKDFYINGKLVTSK